MAKPNKRQIAVARMIEGQGHFWATTNDILSPTHWTDMESSIIELVEEGHLSEEEGKLMQARMDVLFSVVRGLQETKILSPTKDEN